MRSAFRGPAHQLAVRMRINNCTHGHYGPSNQPCTSNCTSAEGLHFSAFHYIYGLFTSVAMYWRFRLSTHRKNEVRKHRVQKSSCVVSTETLRVEKAFQRHDLSQCLSDDDTNMQLVVSIPRVCGVSLDLDLYLKSPVSAMELLQSRLSRLSSLPPGETLNHLLLFISLTHSSRPYPYCKSYSPYMLCVPLLGWIERTSQTCITFAKLEGERDELAITCSLSDTFDFSWHVVEINFLQPRSFSLQCHSQYCVSEMCCM